MQHRVGENGLLPFRTRRIFNVGAEWFFAVREAKDRGPFASLQDAEVALNLFLNDIKQRKAA